jgi:thiol-disulfide isomerase/thioredoxin
MRNKILIAAVILFSACGVFKNNSAKILNERASQASFTHHKKYAWFDTEYNAYKVNAELVNQLKPLKNDLKVLIIAGAWCGDTQRELPRFFKIANEIGIPNQNIELIMVNQNKVSKAINVSVLQVYDVPTFIFFKDGKEQGRIIEKPKNTLEEDVCNLLNLM